MFSHVPYYIGHTQINLCGCLRTEAERDVYAEIAVIVFNQAHIYLYIRPLLRCMEQMSSSARVSRELVCCNASLSVRPSRPVNDREDMCLMHPLSFQHFVLALPLEGSKSPRHASPQRSPLVVVDVYCWRGDLAALMFINKVILGLYFVYLPH